MKAGKGQVPVLAGRAQGACTWQFAAVISSCIAELVAPIQGESILECEKKKSLKLKLLQTLELGMAIFAGSGFFWCCRDQVRSQEKTASVVNRPHHGLGFIWMDCNRNSP